MLRGEVTYVILNRIQCNKCKDILISHSRHDFVACSCYEKSDTEWCAADGGLDYLKRSGTNYTEMSVMTNAPFETIRESLYRGTYGKNRDQKLHYVLLKDMSDEWIKNCIKYNEENGLQEHYVTKFYLKELHYRKENSIAVNER